MVREFLKSIDYPKERIQDMCFAIAIHVDLKADFDGEYNAFTLSVQEADNIDRVGVRQFGAKYLAGGNPAW
jgi:hypothetical protein